MPPTGQSVPWPGDTVGIRVAATPKKLTGTIFWLAGRHALVQPVAARLATVVTHC